MSSNSLHLLLRVLRLRRRGGSVLLLLAAVALLLGLVFAAREWHERSVLLRGPVAQAIEAIAAQSDPAKLATLGGRDANPRVKRIVFYLAQAREAGVAPETVIRAAQRRNGSAGTPRGPLVEASLRRNLKIADGLGLLNSENKEALSRGRQRGVFMTSIGYQRVSPPRNDAPS